MDSLAEYNKKMQPFRDIKGCAFKSYNWYKHGVDERVYEVGLKWELERLGYNVQKQKQLPVYYKDEITDVYLRMDLFIESTSVGNIILELKTLERIEDKQRKQLESYMRLTNTLYGMIINFSPKGVYTEIWEYDSRENTCRHIYI